MRTALLALLVAPVGCSRRDAAGPGVQIAPQDPAAPAKGGTRVVTVKGRNGKLMKVVQKVKPTAVARGSARPVAKAGLRVAAKPAATAARKPVRGNTKVRVAAR